MILAEGNRISGKHLSIRISEGGKMASPEGDGEAGGEIPLPPGGMSLYSVEKNLIRKALDQAHGNKSIAARLLRITRDTLRYKVKKYKLE
jgi:DNA-binding NtrC family response regulator